MDTSPRFGHGRSAPAPLAQAVLLGAILSVAGSAALGADELPLVGLAHVEIRVSDVERSRKFYHDVLGYDEAFDVNDPASGNLTMAFFKVNDRQFIALVPGLKADVVRPMTRIVMRTDNVERLHALLTARGVAPGPITKSPRDGSRTCSVDSLPAQNLDALEFVEYVPGSLQTQAEGKAQSARRVSRRLEHAGIITTDFAVARKFYVETLGFRETWIRNQPDGTPMLNHLRLPGPSGDYVELSYKPKPLNRTQAGTAAHISLEVPEIQAARTLMIERAPGAKPKEPRFGLDQRWQFNLFDPDGTRVELMQPRATPAQ